MLGPFAGSAWLSHITVTSAQSQRHGFLIVRTYPAHLPVWRTEVVRDDFDSPLASSSFSFVVNHLPVWPGWLASCIVISMPSHTEIQGMRPFSILAFIVAGFLASSATPALGLVPPASELMVQVRQGNWGTARAADIQAVLQSVAAVLGPYFPQRTSNRVVVAFGSEGPRVLFDKSADGAYVVLLNVQDTRWDQFAYQFSHELCHIFSNYEQRKTGTKNRDHQWFEESLCEMVSLFTLDRLASRWAQSPPNAHWKDYAPAFREYAGRLLDGQYRQWPVNTTIADWYGENQAQLEDDPYLRDKNAHVARQLLALLDSVPDAIETLGYLNLENSNSDRSFAAYLASWRSSCPEDKRDFVNRIISLFEAGRHKEKTMIALAVSRNPAN